MKKGSIRYYTTSVPVEQSMQEVASLLREYGAQRFEQVWDDETGDTVAVRFNLPVPEAQFGFMPVVLRPRVCALARALQQRHGVDDREQVQRVAWRQLKGILEGILMAADTGMFSTAQVLLGMAETPSGEALWDLMRERETLALPAPEDRVFEAEVEVVE
jgi:hypothetical protein